MARQQDRLALPRQNFQQRTQLKAGARVEPGGRFVHDQHAGIVNERAGEAHALLHSLRQPGQVFAADAAEVRELLDVGQSPGPLRAAEPKLRAKKSRYSHT